MAKPVEDQPEGPELLADAIIDVSKAAKTLLASRLTRKALLVLLHHSSGVSQRDIGIVLDHATHLDQFVKR